MTTQNIGPYLDALKCQVAFYFKDSGGEPIFLSNETRFRSASLIKIPILLAWLHLEQQGEVSRAETCDLDAEPEVRGAGFAWQLATRRLAYRDVLLMMIATSDNLCTNLVIRRAGMERLNQVFAEKLGLTQTTLQRKLMDFEARKRGLDNWIGAKDSICLYELIDGLGEDERMFVDSVLLANTDDMLLKRNLPRDSMDFYHKTGSVSGVLHDWGYTKDKRLFLLLNEVQDEPRAFEVFGRVGELLMDSK